MKFLLLLCLLCASVLAGAQIVTEKGAASDATNDKIHKLDLLIKLEPLALRKEQYPDLLEGVEKARDLARKELSEEDDALAALDPIISDAIDNAVNKGVYPPRETQNKIASTISVFQGKRLAVQYKMMEAVWGLINSKLNEGQRKAMENSFSPGMISPGLKPEQITDEVKLRFFVKTVFLDPLAYDLLVEMSKHAS